MTNLLILLPTFSLPSSEKSVKKGKKDKKGKKSVSSYTSCVYFELIECGGKENVIINVNILIKCFNIVLTQFFDELATDNKTEKEDEPVLKETQGKQVILFLNYYRDII